MRTSAGYTLGDHCRNLDPNDTEECDSLYPLLSRRAEDLLIQEDEDRRALSRGNATIWTPDARSAWEDGLKYGF
ncbi:uncharacterized protein ColSpa_03852 [Colletotrichum spaethianum]|uniref:Uncharacterized protein n=1 Tax=Colletotrichum spaethianum TaxID=700344 RepID=A0AA37P5G0_9PEZI|nr:uncharacterized protein ColSpa_03852 [Colletotrichum spaethianum]GKT43671.1 hypothetical protein ColSpa_03852 [Colletotrichum spaethianum]